MNNIAIVSTIQPDTHYTRYLYKELRNTNNKILLLIDDTIKNDDYIKSQSNANIRKVWKPNLFFPFKILKYVLVNNISILHFQHEFNMYGGTIGVFTFIFAIILLKIARKSVLVTLHAVVDYKSIDDDFLKIFALEKYKALRNIIRITFYVFYKLVGLVSNGIIVHSEYTKDVYVRSYKVNKSKVYVIPIGINSSNNNINKNNFNIKSKWYSVVKNKKIILFFGYIVKRKGIEILIEAFKLLKKDIESVILVLAGGILENQKQYAESLKNAINEEKLSNEIIFTGFLTEDEISILYSKCEFVVLPYTYSISSSLPLSLAFEYGKPVIASNIGTLKEEIINNKNGIFFKSEDHEDLFSKMLLLCKNKMFYRKIVKGVKSERTKRTWQRIAERTYKLYEKL